VRSFGETNLDKTSLLWGGGGEGVSLQSFGAIDLQSLHGASTREGDIRLSCREAPLQIHANLSHVCHRVRE
jgi:hypothetical protein